MVLYREMKWEYGQKSQAISCNFCNIGKAIRITYSECVFVV